MLEYFFLCIFAQLIKNVLYMKTIRYQFVILVLLLCCQGLNAQNSLKADWDHENKASVIRTWKGDTAVVSVLDGSGTSHFILETANSADLLVVDGPSGFAVTDFRIFHDSVFFCGVMSSPQYPIFGFFDIADFFNGTGVCHYCFVPVYIDNSHVADYFQLVEPQRMDVFSYENITHIAFVGTSNLSLDPTAYPRTTVGDVFYDGTSWKCIALYNKDGVNVYTDIAVSDDYVVAVSKDDRDITANVKPYYKGSSFLAAPVAYGMVHRVSDLSRTGDVLVECLGGNSFAMAYQYKEGMNMGSTVKTFNVVPTFAVTESTKTTRGPAYAGNPCQIRQLHYDPNGNFLYLLQDASVQSMVSVESTVSRYSIPMMSSGLDIMRVVNNWRWFGICVHSGSMFQAVGSEPMSKLALWTDYQNTNACSERVDASCVETVPSVDKQGMDEIWVRPVPTGSTWTPIVHKECCEYICGL